MRPLISVIVPVYNVERYLPKCLDSICTQTYSRLEILLVNDGTKDNSQAIINDYAKRDPRIRPILKTNGGLSSARNAALDQATGDYVAFVDSDDWISPRMLEEMVLAAEQNQSDVVVCNYEKVFDSHTESRYLSFQEEVIPVREMGLATYMYRYLFPYAHGHEVWNKLYRREIIASHHIRFEPNKEIFSEDLLFNLYVLCHAERLSAVNKSFYFYLQREGSLMQLPSPQIGTQYITLVEKFRQYSTACGLAHETAPVLPVLLYDLINASITRIYQASGTPAMIAGTLKQMAAEGPSELFAYMRQLAFGRCLRLYRKQTGASLSSELFGRFFAVCCMLRLWGLFSDIKYKRLGGSAAAVLKEV